MDYTLTCGRCGNATRSELTGGDAGDWNVQFEDRHPARVICPGCQTSADAAEAEARAAELRVAADGGGRFVVDPVICMTGTMTDPGTILYGEEHLRRIARTGQAEHLQAVEHLPVGHRE